MCFTPKVSNLFFLICTIFVSRSIGELFGGLRGRLLDSNKNLVMQTLTTIGGVASAMGPTVEKASKVSDMSRFLNICYLVICHYLPALSNC